MFLDDELPRRQRPWQAVVPLAAVGFMFLAVSPLGGQRGTCLLLAVLGIALLAALWAPLRSEAALAAVLAGSAGSLALLQAPMVVLGTLSLGVLTSGGLLVWSWRQALRRSEERRRPLQELLAEAMTQRGENLLALSRQSPILLVCLRHFGCTFCREAMDRLSREQMAIQAGGTRLVLVHQSTEEEAEPILAAHGLLSVDRVSDPRRWLYFHLGLRRGGPWQLLGPRVWCRAVAAGLFRRYGLGRVLGDARQMPGVFLIRDGVVLSAFFHRTVADNPDYQGLAQCPPPSFNH